MTEKRQDPRSPEGQADTSPTTKNNKTERRERGILKPFGEDPKTCEHVCECLCAVTGPPRDPYADEREMFDEIERRRRLREHLKACRTESRHDAIAAAVVELIEAAL